MANLYSAILYDLSSKRIRIYEDKIFLSEEEAEEEMNSQLKTSKNERYYGCIPLPTTAMIKKMKEQGNGEKKKK